MTVPKLSARLQAVASFVKRGDIVADVGCDHAYLPVYLACKGISERVYAIDLNKKPLTAASKTVEKFHMQHRVFLIQSDGLEKVPRDFQTLIIAGMGGELIIRILQRALFLKEKKTRLILQPMSFAPALRAYLYREGYAITEEVPVIDGGHIYCVLSAKYTGAFKMLSDFESVAGKMVQRDDPEALIYLQREWKKYERIGKGRHSQDYLKLAEQLRETIEQKERNR